MTVKVVIHEAEEGGFCAEVPAFPGCATQGETLVGLGSPKNRVSRSRLLAFPLRCVLEDALGARVMDELAVRDQAFLHRNLAPGAGAIREVCQSGGSLLGLGFRGQGHTRILHDRLQGCQ